MQAHNLDLILTLAGGLCGALVLGYGALRLRLPPILGYILAGLLIGPYTPGFVANHRIAEQLAELGVVLLMFGVGLHFHLKDLLAVRGIAVSGALFQIVSATAITAMATRALGWRSDAGVVFGVALSVASTVVLTRVLADNRDLQTQTGRIAIGWLVVEDIFTVFALVVLPALFGRSGGNIAGEMGWAAVKLAALVALTLGPGTRLIPYLLALVARTNSRELFTLAVLAVAIGLAVGSAQVFGVSMALGAFLAGMVVGQSEFSYRAASEALPVRDAFAVLFFVSVGMLFDPQQLMHEPVLIAVTIAIVLLAKPLAALVITLALGYGMRIGLRVAVALAQIGEFSFIVAVLGQQLGILPPAAMHALVATAIFTITVNPLLYRLVPRLSNRAGRKAVPLAAGESVAVGPRAVVVGYGPVGAAVTRLLRAHGFAPTVVELNLDTFRQLQRAGVKAVYGDAAQPGVLEEAGVENADALILSAPSSPEIAETIRAARSLNPGIKVLARSAFLSHAEALRTAGADQVFSGEAEVAMGMTEALLRHLELAPAQIDVELERARAALYERQ